MSAPRVALVVALTLTAFAANSLLCRAALAGGAIGPAAFASLRIAAGALALAGLIASRPRGRARLGGTIAGAGALFGYVAGFSLAYLELDTGTGALLLFGAVQLTMVGAGLARGERPGAVEWLGIALAIGGLAVLTTPGLTAPAPLAAAAMVGAGVAWGVYSLLGRRSADPIADTAGNFVRALVPTAIFAPLAFAIRGDGPIHASGVVLAVVSGAVTSGLGYALWYAVVPALSRTRAALLQLIVPVLAALAGTLLLGEPMTVRLATALVLVPGGVAIAVRARAALPADVTRSAAARTSVPPGPRPDPR